MASPNADKESDSDRPIFPQLPFFLWFFFLVLFFLHRRFVRQNSNLSCAWKKAQQGDVSFMSLHTGSFFFLSLPPSLQPAYYHHGLSTNEEDMIPLLSFHLSKPQRKRERERTAHGSSPSMFFSQKILFFCVHLPLHGHIYSEMWLMLIKGEWVYGKG